MLEYFKIFNFLPGQIQLLAVNFNINNIYSSKTYKKFSGMSLSGYYVHYALHTRRHRQNLFTGVYFKNNFMYKRDVYFVANNLRLLLKFQKCVCRTKRCTLLLPSDF